MNIKIGTRGSILALFQAEIAKIHLLEYFKNIKKEIYIDIIPIITSGDNAKKSIAEIGGKELFTKEIDEALLTNKIDVAVHSMKDIPAFFSDKITFGAFLCREKANDVFISHKYNSLSHMPTGSRIGTSSIRRNLQLSNHNIIPIQGNIDTRIKKCENENLDGIILAYAGLKRINMEHKIKEIIPYSKMIPSIGQGIIALQTLKDNIEILQILHNITHIPTEICAISERAFVETINGNCRTPLGGIAEITSNETLVFRAMLATKIGVFYSTDTSKISDAKMLGIELAKKLIIDSKFNSFPLSYG